MLGRDRLPAVGRAARAAFAEDGLRPRRAAVDADKGVAGGVEAVGRPVGPEDGVVVAPLAVLGLVIDRRAADLDLAGGVVALEVRGVVHRIPEAELHIGEETQLFFRVCVVADGDAHQEAVVALGDEQLLRDGDAVLRALDHGVAQTVAALVAVKPGLHGLPAGVPDALAVLYINTEALGVERAVVVAVTRQTPQPRVAVKGVAARRVGAERKEGLAAEVVDPGQGRARRGDHVFPARVVEVSESHRHVLLKFRKRLSVFLPV